MILTFCQHEETIDKLTPEGPHYARRDCARCGRSIRWLPSPESIERAARITSAVDRLKSRELSAWDRDFLNGFPAKPSPKQLAILDKIQAKHP